MSCPVCNECGKTFRKKQGLRMHLIRAHSPKGKVKEAKFEQPTATFESKLVFEPSSPSIEEAITILLNQRAELDKQIETLRKVLTSFHK